MSAPHASRINGLGELIRQASLKRAPPVDDWDPPYCGDIGLEIDVRGNWIYRGGTIDRPALVKLFSSVLRCEEDGRHFLVTPVEKVDVNVADAPFLAVEMQVDGSGDGQTLTFRSNVDDVVIAGPDHPLLFRSGADAEETKPYVRVRGRLEARLTRAVYFDLVELVEFDEDDPESRPFVQSAGVKFYFDATANS